jgi:hypothetical protein
MPPQTQPDTAETTKDQLEKKFVTDVRSQLATLTGEVSMRNKVIMENDSYIYGDLLSKSLNVPAGHDFTPVNWLRRVCEIHRTQTMGDGFTISSSYHGEDVDSVDDPDQKKQLELNNTVKKNNASARNKLFQAILRDNGGQAVFAKMVENSSAVGTSVLKTWYDENEGKYKLDMIEAVEHFYALWKKSNFREASLYAYVYQINKSDAVKEYNAPADVPTSPLGMPLAVLTSVNIVEYISTQPMVTVMEVCGKVQGWKTDGNGNLQECEVGDETDLNCMIVGNVVHQVVDDPKYLPKYYIFPNKQIRRRPWGLPDVTSAAVNINQTYIETLSDWRTVQAKVNFPKFKAFGFGLETQLPKPKARTVEMIGLGEGQDIQPIQNPNSEVGSELDFIRTLDELKQSFVRETGISRQLFDIPDSNVSNSNQAAMTAMRSISDQVEARRLLWEPIIQRVFSDAIKCLALWDDNIKDLDQEDEDWYIRVEWPPSMRKDDPSYQTTKLNRFISGTMSVQSFLESLGENAKEEIDRMSDEMENPITAAIHGKLLTLMAELKIAGPPTAAPPKIAVNLRGDLTPEQETNLSVQHGFGEGPIFGPTSGPQGELGIRATDNAVNQGMVTGQGYSAGQPVISGPGAASLPSSPAPNALGTQPGNTTGGAQPTQPQLTTPPTGNTPGAQTMSQPGSGATQNSAKGNVNQTNQRRGRK